MSRRAAALWGPVAAVAAGIFALSSLPATGVPGGVPDWLLHGLEYGALGFTLARAAGGGLRRRPGVSAVGVAVLVGSLYGATDEWHQSFVPGRTPAAGDLAADAAGSLAGALAAVAASRLRHRTAPAGTAESP
jgi:VanZ family protein